MRSIMISTCSSRFRTITRHTRKRRDSAGPRSTLRVLRSAFRSPGRRSGTDPAFPGLRGPHRARLLAWSPTRSSRLIMSPFLRVNQRVTEEPVEDELRVALAGDGPSLGVIGDVAAFRVRREQPFGRQFQRTVRRRGADLVRDQLIDRGKSRSSFESRPDRKRCAAAWCEEKPDAPMLSTMMRSARCWANGAVIGEHWKSCSDAPSIFHEGGCTPLGLNRATNRRGGCVAVTAFAERAIAFKNGSGSIAPAAPEGKSGG